MLSGPVDLSERMQERSHVEQRSSGGRGKGGQGYLERRRFVKTGGNKVI